MSDLLAWWSSLPLPELHWWRPWWLLAALPALLLTWGLHRLPPTGLARWQQHIDAELLPALLQGNSAPKRRWPLHLLLLGWVLAVVALAGPAWEKSNASALKRADALVILLDLSPSMLSQDVPPSRIQAAQYKLLDLLQQRKEGYTALIGYSGSAHVVAPLSDDSNTIAALVPTLEPGVMPSLGSQTEEAVAEAMQLVKNAHFPRARFLLVTDGVDATAADTIRSQLSGQPFTLSIIGVGTAQGGTVPLAKGDVLRDATGQPRRFPIDTSPLRDLAESLGGRYSDITLDDSDILPLTEAQALQSDQPKQNDKRELEQWRDAGYWLVFPLLLLALFAFRRGLLMGFFLPVAVCLAPSPARALDWNSLWLTPDQQAQQKLQQHDATAAAQLFENPQWKAYAEYESGQHEKAADHFASEETAAAQYNRGNALAHSGQLQQALQSYEQALKLQPNFDNATFNKSLVEKLIEQQKQQQEKNQQNQNQKNPNQQNQDQQNQGQQNQGQQNQGQQNQGQQPAGDQSQQQPGEQQGQPSTSSAGQQAGDQGQQASGDGASQTDQDDPLKKDPAQQNNSSEQPPAPSQQQADSAGNPPSSPAASQPDNTTQEATKSTQAQAEAPKDKQPASGEQPEQANLNDSDKAKAADAETPEQREKRQATEQWLRKVPDDPGSLLRNKFEYYYQQKQRETGRARRTVENDRW